MTLFEIDGPPVMPPWLGNAAFHASHRSNLLRKDPGFYGRYGWPEPPDLPYVWHAGRGAVRKDGMIIRQCPARPSSSEEGRLGQECVRTGRSRLSQYHSKKTK